MTNPTIALHDDGKPAVRPGPERQMNFAVSAIAVTACGVDAALAACTGRSPTPSVGASTAPQLVRSSSASHC